jgi:hypothetical protein
MSAALFRPLTPQWGMQKHWTDGSRMHDVAAEFIKPNDRLSSFERLEIYNRLSVMATQWPPAAAVSAATNPAGPPPITTRS